MLFFTSFEKLLIKRFLFSKKTDGFISIFSWFSIIGITIGVAAIIIVMSVMNGFREEITSKLLGINGHINIFEQNQEITIDHLKFLKTLDLNLQQITPFTHTQALIVKDDISKGVFLRGYDNNFLPEKHFLKDKIVLGQVFGENLDDVVVGYAFANKLNLNIGDKFKIAIPKTDKTIFGNIPRFKTLTIKGIFDLGMYEYDSNFIFTNVLLANKLLLKDDKTFNQIELFLNQQDETDFIQNKINREIENNQLKLYSTSWKQNNKTLINALNVEKNVMFLILTLIIIVASMNIISGLVIFVKEKNKDIGMLKTIGLTNKSLIKIFLTMGFLIGCIGTGAGGLIGILFSINIESIQRFVEKILRVELFAKEIYYLSNLPSKIENLEVLFVLLISLIICLLATFFPALKSIKVDPVKSLKNE